MGSVSVEKNHGFSRKKTGFENFVNAASKSNPLGWINVGGYNLGDPLDFAGNRRAGPRPPGAGAPPPPVDTTASMLREISRSETDAELRRGRRSMLYGEGYRPKGSTGGR